MIPNEYPSLTFDLGDTADMLRDSVRSFASDKIAPRAEAIDRDNEFPIDLYAAPQGEAFQLRTMLEKLDEKREMLEDKRRDLDAAISNMDKYAARCRERLAELESRQEAAE